MHHRELQNFQACNKRPAASSAPSEVEDKSKTRKLLQSWITAVEPGRNAPATVVEVDVLGDGSSSMRFMVLGRGPTQTVLGSKQAGGRSEVRVMPTRQLPHATCVALAAVASRASTAVLQHGFRRDEFEDVVFTRAAGSTVEQHNCLLIRQVPEGTDESGSRRTIPRGFSAMCVNAPMREFLIDRMSWTYVKNGKTQSLQCALKGDDVKVAGRDNPDRASTYYDPAPDAVYALDFRGQKLAIPALEVFNVMVNHNTMLPFSCPTTVYSSPQKLLRGLQSWVGGDRLTLGYTPTPGTRPTSDEIGHALTLQALRLAPETGEWRSLGTRATPTDNPCFVLCNGQTTKDGMQKVSWADAKGCRSPDCGLAKLGYRLVGNAWAIAPTRPFSPDDKRKRCARTDYEKRRREEAKA